MTGKRKPKRSTLGASYAATRDRADRWRQLKSCAIAWLAAPEGSQVMSELKEHLSELDRIESYFAYPGPRIVKSLKDLLEKEDSGAFEHLCSLVVRMLVSEAYRVYSANDQEQKDVAEQNQHEASYGLILDERPYFEVLVVDALPAKDRDHLRNGLLAYREDHDPFVYDLVIVPSFEDALIAVLLNHNIQSVVIRYEFPMKSRHRLRMAERALVRYENGDSEGDSVGIALANAIADLRPELDLFLVSDANVEDIAGTHHHLFQRIFFRQEDLRELHLSLLKGVQSRYHTPFFTALNNYTRRPTGVFHALPIARGKSVSRSHWIREMEDLFGASLFLAETSATTAGLDSLLAPHGSLREAQDMAARAFGAEHTFYVTNGTSTANKITLQALTRPGDIVLAVRDCHMSHHYAFVLCGVSPLYMDPYPLRRFGFYGGVPINVIKKHLLDLKARGELHRARVLLLTNCTFDGLVYNPLQVMEQVLAIHPEMSFVWDEAWFAFAAFTPITRRRTAMAAAKTLTARLRSESYREEYRVWKEGFDASEDKDKWFGRLMADPDRAKVRVYATQSTHKTLTSLRQGSMIHVHDEDYGAKAAESFHQAYLTHTSSSPNYPILASLDIGRRQVELEGYELVNHAVELALVLRQRINTDPELSRWFHVLTPHDLVPEEYRKSGFAEYRLAQLVDWERMDEAWESDEFCLDPTRVTLFTGNTAIDGDSFKRLLIDNYDIQVNKTSQNTALFMTHIGTSRGSVAHLIDVLSRMGETLNAQARTENTHRAALRRAKQEQLNRELGPLPNFSGFHRKFHDSEKAGLEGKVREAYFLSVDESKVSYLRLDGSAQAELDAGREVVSANFVTPYPPGFPVLVPGQLLSREILAFLKSVERTEIHGYDSELGLRILTPEALA